MAEQASENSERIYLQPVAAPSILGLYAFAGPTLILASHTAHWWAARRTRCTSGRSPPCSGVSPSSPPPCERIRPAMGSLRGCTVRGAPSGWAGASSSS